jgi:tRNA threonylcarbamoyladenosine modification (KEOPS) complex  Pcc1 subunit
MKITKDHFSIQSTIKLLFNKPELCSYSFNTFYPELNSIESKRSTIAMEQKGNSLIFSIESQDITAFRASVNEIVSFGKIIDDTIHLSENF